MTANSDEKSPDRPLTRREIRERMMAEQQLQYESAEESAEAVRTMQMLVVDPQQQEPEQTQSVSDEPQVEDMSPEELERLAAEYAEIEALIQIDPNNPDGTPRTRAEVRRLHQAEFERIREERAAERAAAAAEAAAEETEPAAPESVVDSNLDEDGLPMTQEFAVADLLGEAAVESEAVADSEAEEEAAAAEPEAAPEEKKGITAWFRKKKKEPVAADEDTEAGAEDAEAAQPADAQTVDTAQTEALQLGEDPSFEELLVESVNAEQEAVDREDQDAAEPESAAEPADETAEGTASEAELPVADEFVDVDEPFSAAEETGDDSDETPAAEADADGDADDSEEVPEPQSAKAAYSFPNIVPLEEPEPVFDDHEARARKREETDFDSLINRAGSDDTSSTVTSGTSALILPDMPNTDTLTGPIGATGEVFLSGTIELPRSLGEVGAHSLTADDLGLDDDSDDSDHTDETTRPVSAARAVSAQTTNYSMLSEGKKEHSKKPLAFALGGGTLVVVVAGVVYWVVSSGVLG